LLAAHRDQASAIPIVFVSIYPPAGVLRSPAVAYLVMPTAPAASKSALRWLKRPAAPGPWRGFAVQASHRPRA